MKTQNDEQGLWARTPVANLIRYVPSGIHFARVRIGGKLIRQSLQTDRISVARLLDLASEEGARDGNPARRIKKMRVRPKTLNLPDHEQFVAFTERIAAAGAWCSQECADLVRFLAYGGFRNGEAATITWADYDYVGSEKHRQVRESGRGTAETRWRRKDGTVLDALLSSLALNPGDLSAGVTFTALDPSCENVDNLSLRNFKYLWLDITERKRTEEARAQLESHLRQPQKMESVGRLAGGVAQDFNNMLQAIQGNAALALAETPPGSTVRDNLEEIQK